MNQKGYSLASVLVGIAFLGFMGLAMMRLGDTANIVEKQSKATFNWTQSLSETQKALSNPEFCTANFKGKIFPNSGTKAVNLFRNNGPNLLKSKFLVKGQKLGNLVVERVELMKHSDLEPTAKLGNLVVTVQKTVGKRTSTQSHSIPVMFEVEETTLEIVSCNRGLTVDSGNSTAAKVCHLASNGRQIYDPKTDRCIPLEVKSCFGGTRRSASCQMAKSRAVSCYASGIDDNFDDTLDRDIEGGRVSRSKPRPYVTSLDRSTNTCQCFYATDKADTSNAICNVCCASTNPDVAGLLDD